MKKQIESAHVEIADLEKLGWELEIDEVSREDWHILLENNDENRWMWSLCDKHNNAPYHPEWAGDDEMVSNDVVELTKAGKLWGMRYK